VLEGAAVVVVASAAVLVVAGSGMVGHGEFHSNEHGPWIFHFTIPGAPGLRP